MTLDEEYAAQAREARGNEAIRYGENRRLWAMIAAGIAILLVLKTKWFLIISIPMLLIAAVAYFK